MALTEFQLIERFFNKQKIERADVVLGIGDDAALLKIPSGQLLAISVDTLVAGVHFPSDTAAYDIGYKALAVNLSDMAAMGAQPAWATLALTIPKADRRWLRDFSRGFFALCAQYDLQLIGGDTTHGPLSITVQIHGFVPPHKALRRSTAQAGDLIYVTGTLGNAGLALKLLKKDITTTHKITAVQRRKLIKTLNRPQPRIAEGMALRGIASSAIDLSDGLAADLGHILEASGVGAVVYLDDLPLSPTLKQNLPQKEAWLLALSAGDDYELCFTVPPSNKNKLQKALEQTGCDYVCIGEIVEKQELHFKTHAGEIFQVVKKGYQHF